MEAKKRLAWAVTAMYHGEEGAGQGEAHFARVHQAREEPEKIEEMTMVPGRRLLWSVLKDAGLAKSTSEARRLIQQGAIAVDRAKVTSTDYELDPGRHLVQVGRRQFKHLIIPSPQA
jgi:tyrosyl-tRNA synthetase